MTDILTREQWRARPPKRPLVKWPKGLPSGITVHHGGAYYDPNQDPARVVAAVQRQYQDIKDHTDIAYNMMVIPTANDGAIIACGRGFEWIGSANGDQAVNKSHLSICVVGMYLTDDENRAITPAGKTPDRINLINEALVIAVGEVVDLAVYQNPTITTIRPHSADNATICPGGQWRSVMAAGWLNKRGVVPVGV